MNNTIKTNTTYIHYGHDRFIRESFKSIKNRQAKKPIGGLWGSPVNSKYGWKEWCIKEDCKVSTLNKNFRFKLSAETKLCIINSHADLKKLPYITYNEITHVPDFENLSKKYGAIYLTEQGHISTSFILPLNLDGWDCECILVMNVDCIIPID